MAGLHKPTKCGHCSSVDLHREWHPEKWVCSNGHIVVTRGKKPQTGICRDCGKSESETKFDNYGNICKLCKSKYNKNYGVMNKEKIKKHHRDYYKDNRPRLRKYSNEYWQSTPELFISSLVRRCRVCAVAKLSGKLRKIPFVCSITKDDLLELWKKQDGKCAITNLKMEHKWGLLNSISVDRIVSDNGYVLGNVQLVCSGINMLKNNKTIDEVHIFLNQYFEHRLHRRKLGLENLEKFREEVASEELAIVDKQIIADIESAIVDKQVSG